MSLTKNLPPPTKVFFQLQTRRHAASFERMNSSLSLLLPELCACKATYDPVVLMRKSPKPARRKSVRENVKIVDNERLDICIRGPWNSCEKTFFDIRITHLTSKSHARMTLSQTRRINITKNSVKPLQFVAVLIISDWLLWFPPLPGFNLVHSKYTMCPAGHTCNCDTPSWSVGNCVATSWSMLIKNVFCLCCVRLCYDDIGCCMAFCFITSIVISLIYVHISLVSLYTLNF